MLGSITPLGERGRGKRWEITMTAFVTGSVVAGGGLGALLGLIGASIPGLGGSGSPRLWLLAGLIAAGVALDAGAAGLDLPTVHRQVNERWLDRYRGWIYGAGFGFQLGLGVVTVVNVSAVYTTLAAALLAASPSWGAVIGAAFGLVRAATGFSVAGVRRPGHLARVDRRLRAWDGLSRGAALAVEGALAGMCVLVALR